MLLRFPGYLRGLGRGPRDPCKQGSGILVDFRPDRWPNPPLLFLPRPHPHPKHRTLVACSRVNGGHSLTSHAWVQQFPAGARGPCGQPHWQRPWPCGRGPIPREAERVSGLILPRPLPRRGVRNSAAAVWTSGLEPGWVQGLTRPDLAPSRPVSGLDGWLGNRGRLSRVLSCLVRLLSASLTCTGTEQPAASQVEGPPGGHQPLLCLARACSPVGTVATGGCPRVWRQHQSQPQCAAADWTASSGTRWEGVAV